MRSRWVTFSPTTGDKRTNLNTQRKPFRLLQLWVECTTGSDGGDRVPVISFRIEQADVFRIAAPALGAGGTGLIYFAQRADKHFDFSDAPAEVIQIPTEGIKVMPEQKLELWFDGGWPGDSVTTIIAQIIEQDDVPQLQPSAL